MRKRRITILAAVSLSLLCACSKEADLSVTSQDPPAAVVSSVETAISETSESIDESEENPVKEINHNLVCDRWADSGSFKMYTSDEEFFDFSYDYSVPQIVDDTEDAKEINYFIENLFGDMHETMQKASKEGRITADEFDKTECIQTNYDCYWNGSLASIVIYSTGYYDNATKYNVYNYDFETGAQVSNEEIFALKGISGDKFEENIRRAAVYSLDMEMQQFFRYEMPLTESELWYSDVVDKNVQTMYGDYLVARAKTVNSDNIDKFMPVYLDDQGQLKAVTHLFNMGMYGEVTSILSPIEWVNCGVRASSGHLLDVESKGDGVYLTIYGDYWPDDIREEFPSFDFSKEYKIDGLFKNYVNAIISWVGNGKQPYILLLSDDGMISYVDVWEGIASEYFCAVEPLWGLENIKSISMDSEYRIVAINGDGISIDVEDALYMMLNCKYVDFEKNMLNLGNVSRYSAIVTHKESGQDIEYEEMIGFTDDEYHMFVRESYRSSDYAGGAQVGYITFNGMNEKGMVFHFSLVGEDGELRGTMAMNVYSFWDGEFSDFVDEADVVWLSGLDIFESQGNRVMLKSSVG